MDRGKEGYRRFEGTWPRLTTGVIFEWVKKWLVAKVLHVGFPFGGILSPCILLCIMYGYEAIEKVTDLTVN